MKIGITTGDPAGIGPDVALLFALGKHSCTDELTIIGDCKLLHERSIALGLEDKLKTLNTTQPHTTLMNIQTKVTVIAGSTDPRNARYVLAQIDAAIAGCRNGIFDAIVTGPVNKATINEAGIDFSGHTEYFADACDCETVMMLACEKFRVALVTTHLPIKSISKSLSYERLKTTLQIVHKDMQRLFGISRPRIAVCGLNPHAGEDGYLGDEEKNIIQPVLQELSQTSDLSDPVFIGPLPADTAFTPQQLSQCDVVVAMYHDQGLPVIKYADFDHAVNVTLGLPFIRTSVDHGTALDLAGTGNASPANLKAAVAFASTLAKRTVAKKHESLSG